MTGRQKPSDDPASAAERIVFVIDDDVAMRATLSSLFRSMGLRVDLFGSAREFAQVKMPDVASCLVLDIRLPGVSGLDFQAELAEADIRIPIIFVLLPAEFIRAAFARISATRNQSCPTHGRGWCM